MKIEVTVTKGNLSEDCIKDAMKDFIKGVVINDKPITSSGRSIRTS